MAKLNQRHVVQHPDGGWAVKKPHALHASSRHSTQAQAHTRAKEILSHSGGGEAVTHGRDGQIRKSDTVQPATADWSLLSPEGRVLFYIALCPGSTTEAIARLQALADATHPRASLYIETDRDETAAGYALAHAIIAATSRRQE